MATEQTSGQPNPEDPADMSDYEEDEAADLLDEGKSDEGDKGEDKGEYDHDIEQLVERFIQESEDLTGDDYEIYVEQLESRYEGMIDWMHDNWQRLEAHGKSFFTLAENTYWEYSTLELEQEKYRHAEQNGNIYDGLASTHGHFRRWVKGTQLEATDAMERSRGRLLKLLGDKRMKMRLVSNLESL